jgi:alpha-beta hydrolase superfamily lysophospholipase
MSEEFSMRQFNGHRLATVFHEAGGTKLVVFCHGFHGQKSGDSRRFVIAARTLAEHGISSLRFDQYGCGDSEGDFKDVSFDDWVATTREIVGQYVSGGTRVALFGQSMGACTALCVAADLPGITAVVAWVPGASVEPFVPSPGGFSEEAGQIVPDRYWREAHDAVIADRYARVAAPAYLVFGTADLYVTEADRRALIERAQPHHRIDVFEGYAHSAWTYAQSTEILGRSCGFLVDAFAART